MSEKALYIGIMSGTSLDGVDCALVEIDDQSVTLRDALDYPYPDHLRQKVLAMCLGQPTRLDEIGALDHQLGHLYADAALALLAKSGTKARDIAAIGNHGQTVFHQPSGPTPFTTQLGDAHIIAAKTGIDTIADFRRKDMALGGQGAPLVPAFHQALFPVTDSSVAVLNIGGIANISLIRPGKPVIGYDTGPGNMLMDAWCEKHRGDPFDKDAQWAQQGQVHTPLLDALLTDPYLTQPAPKSTGREHYNLPWLMAQLTPFSLPAEDVQRTLCEFTAISIANEVTRYAEGPHPELLVCGGGVRNPLLMNRLAALLPQWQVSSTSDKGVDSDNMEAMAFAWLAYRRLHGLPSNLPDVTGAQRSASLGVMYWAEK